MSGTSKRRAKKEKGANVFDGKHAKVSDGFDNFISRVGMNNNNSLSAGVYTFNYVTRNRQLIEAAYRGSWIVGQVIDTIPEDMTKAGLEISTNESKQDINDLHAQVSRKQIWQSVCATLKWGYLYGGAIAVMQIEGQDLETPLNYDTIKEGQFKGLAVYDRWQVNPHVNNIIKEGPNMGLPQYYDLVVNPVSLTKSWEPDDGKIGGTGQITVHHSRVIRGIGIELPYYQAITEMMWGESKLERLWDRLISFDTATMSCANLIERANNRTIGVDKLREIVALGGKAQMGLEKQFAMMREFQTNEGLTLLDKNDTFTSTSYSFAGLSDVMLQFGQQLSGASGIPLVRLFGQSPAGLSATGDSDLRTYYDNINSQQESKLREPFEKILKVMWASTYGEKAPSDLQFKFKPLWQMSAMDQATIAKIKADTILEVEEAGLLSRPGAMTELRDSAKDTGMFSSITDEDIAQAQEDHDNPPQPEIPTKVEPETNPDGVNKLAEAKKIGDKVLDSQFKKLFTKIKEWAGR